MQQTSSRSRALQIRVGGAVANDDGEAFAGGASRVRGPSRTEEVTSRSVEGAGI